MARITFLLITLFALASCSSMPSADRDPASQEQGEEHKVRDYQAEMNGLFNY